MPASENAWDQSQPVDLTNCDKEPIHIPNRVQPHGVMLVIEPDTLTVLQCSDNSADVLGIQPNQLLQQHLDHLLEPELIAYLRTYIQDGGLEANPLYISTIKFGTQHAYLDSIAHLFDGLLIFELEPARQRRTGPPLDPYWEAKLAISRLQNATSLQAFYDLAVQQVRALTGFDRVMLYQFLEDDSGVVVAEDRNDQLPPYLGLRYPASDIPQQARALYTRNLLRLIPDISAMPAQLVPTINPLNGHPVDMSYAVLRSVSPIHIEYLTNMGVSASMSISLLRDGQLWGLIACHHVSGPRYVPYDVRASCEFLGQVVASQLTAKEDNENYSYRISLRATQARFVELITNTSSLVEGLSDYMPNMLNFVTAHGAAVCFENECRCLGQTPPESEIRNLVEWLALTQTDQGVFATDSLPSHASEFAAITDTASGVLAITVSRGRRDYLLWFRPEATQTVTWAGNPNKPVEMTDGGLRLSPRKSFEKWKETVHQTSEPWQPWEIQAAQSLREAILELLLRKTDVIKKLHDELERSNAELDSFAYIASHDLKEPLRGIHNYASFLLEDYANQLDEAGVAHLNTLMTLTERMESLIESLLYYSRVGRVEIAFQETDLNEVLKSTQVLLQPHLHDPNHHLRIPRPLPTIVCDHVRVGEVFYNLIGNALKYNTQREKWVEVGFQEPQSPGQPSTFYVRDNGIGIREKHFDQIFKIFKRLHPRDSFGGGTGVGLTIARRIIERHGGTIWVESSYGVGTTFYFTLQPPGQALAQLT